MRRGTTPTYTVKVGEQNMPNVEDICIAFEQTSTGVELYKHIKDSGSFTTDGGFVTLTQAETRAFSKGTVKVQVIVKLKDGTVYSDDIQKDKVVDVLHEADH